MQFSIVLESKRKKKSKNGALKNLQKQSHFFFEKIIFAEILNKNSRIKHLKITNSFEIKL